MKKHKFSYIFIKIYFLIVNNVFFNIFICLIKKMNPKLNSFFYNLNLEY